MYNSFDSADAFSLEEDAQSIMGKPDCSTKALLCGTLGALMSLGGLFCLSATLSGLTNGSYETPLLWGCVLGILGFFSAAMAMVVLYWQYTHVHALEEDLYRAHAELELGKSRANSTNRLDGKAGHLRPRIFDTDTCMERIANSTAQTLQIVSDIEADVLTNDCYNDVSLHVSIAHIKKAALTSEASMMYHLALEVKKIRPHLAPPIYEVEWCALVNRIPAGHEDEELAFDYVSKGRRPLSWSRAREILERFIRARLRIVGKMLHKLDKQTAMSNEVPPAGAGNTYGTRGSRSGAGGGDTVKTNGQKPEIEFHLKRQTEALRNLKSRYEDELGQLKLANREDHKQIQDLTQQLQELRKGIDDEADDETQITGADTERAGGP
mmetsp:Transcript_11876/g.16607  ORF Transcript_11876/g.16607 Transcript_11876/m.16607 type:complete len:381 (+) Transcript_11876:98-1240(+)|eukprot:CAMPEP_0184487992 /NCGR_PEP_ID=MMETSP0113_2-20130426/10462_1 /TAXON_ID=91329 /ORGANISM="Norrisiella sphaerica, Strain BC52" /LENGTH=380 /DNA_ID=CAMNT_0026870451 /DNA_START=98 /DNA_END=1240 /DNA_ORIENTATION=+